MTTVFILSGFNMHPTPESHWYGQLREGLEAKGYRVVPVDISWKRTTPSQYADKFSIIYQKEKSETTIVIGNSFGAVVALLAASRTAPDRLYLCSLSPYFKEDFSEKGERAGLRYFGKRRLADLRALSAKKLAAAIPAQTKTFVVYGEKEHQSSPALVGRCVETARDILGATVKELPGVPHDMADERYTQALLTIV